MDPSSQFIVPTIIDVPELIVTNEDIDYEDAGFFGAALGASSVWPAGAKLQFLSTALCYVIGLGNMWHFPYLCYKYAGGAFLAAYSLVIVAVGVPLVLMELAFGQYANEGPITIWRISPAFEGIGYSMCLISAVIAIYYNLVNSWILHYLFATLTLGPLPWTSCGNSWNGQDCFLNSDEPLIARAKSNCSAIPAPDEPAAAASNASAGGSILLVPGNCSSTNATAFAFDKIINTTNEVSLPANDYFHNNVLQIDSAGLNWSGASCLVLVWLIVFTVLFKNVRPITSSPIILVGLVMPYLSLFALFTRALTLPGAGLGVTQYFSADWDRLQNIDIWADAIAQVFFSLSPCWGGIITLANMNKFHNNFHSDTMLIVALNYVTSFAAGLLTFATLGYMSQYSGVKFAEVADSGIGLIFLVYPEAVAQFPLASLNSLVFFATLLFLGLTSQLTVIETVLTTIIDTWPHKLRYRRPLVLAVLCGSMLLLSLFMCLGNGFYLLQIVDAFAGTLSGMFIGILELIAIAWVYGMENFIQDIDDMISVHRPLFPSRAYWYFMWRYLTPSVLFAVLLFCLTDCPPLGYRGHQHPDWSSKAGLAMTILTVAVVPAIALVRLLLVPHGSLLDRISYLCRPSEDWAPSSYVSGPKLINRHQVFNDDGELRASGGSGAHEDGEHRPGYCSTTYTSKSDDRLNKSDEAIDDDSRDDEDLKVVDGKASYIIPEEEDEDEEEEVAGLITNETNV